MRSRLRAAVISLVLVAGCYSAPTDPGAALPGDIASIRLVDQNGVDRTSHLPLFPGLAETLTVHPYRADGMPIAVIEGGATSTFVFSPSNLASVQAAVDPLSKIISPTARPGAGGAFYVTLQFPFDTVAKTFGPFDVLVH